MSSIRHYAAAQQEGRGPAESMAIGEFGGAPASGGPVLSNGLYWLYEAGHAALQPARAFADMTKLYFKNPLNPFAHTTYGKTLAAAAELFERSTRRYAKPDWRIDSVLVGGERAPIRRRHRVGAAVLPAAPFRAHVLSHAAAAATEAPDRRADVGALRDAAARHRRGVPAQPRRLHHRLDRCAHGAAGAGPLRSRRLHRLRHRHAAFPRRRHPRRRGVPAVGAGAGRHRADGGGRRSLRAALDHA